VSLANQGDPGSASQVGGRFKFPEAAIRIGEDGAGPGQAIGLEGGDAGEAAEEGLKAVHHDRAPGCFGMES